MKVMKHTEGVSGSLSVQIFDPIPGGLEVIFIHLYQSVSPGYDLTAKADDVKRVLVSNLLLYHTEIHENYQYALLNQYA